MKVTPLTPQDIIKKGDLLLVEGNSRIELHKVLLVKPEGISEEVILRKKDNTYFNRKMYHDGRSWVKQVLKVSE